MRDFRRVPVFDVVSAAVRDGLAGSEGSCLISAMNGYTRGMRMFSLLFAFIALVMLAMFVIYLFRGPVDPLISVGLFISFLACLAPALLLLKPFESREELRRRREKAREERERRRGSSD